MKKSPKAQQMLMDFKCKLILGYLWLKVLKFQSAKLVHARKMVIGCLMCGEIS
jgi:hypothetical protein